jgi:hypothetical protein
MTITDSNELRKKAGLYARRKGWSFWNQRGIILQNAPSVGAKL